MIRTRSRAVGAAVLGLLVPVVPVIPSLASIGCGTDSRCDVSGHACTWLGMPGQTGFNGDGHDRLGTMLYWTMDMQFARDGSVCSSTGTTTWSAS